MQVQWWKCYLTNITPFWLFPTVPSLSLPMDDVIDNILIGTKNGTTISGAALVAGQVGNGIYLGNHTSLVDYGIHLSDCFYDPDVCDAGVTFAIWIRRDDGAKGYLLDSGGSRYSAKGNQSYTHYHQHLNHYYVCNYCRQWWRLHEVNNAIEMEACKFTTRNSRLLAIQQNVLEMDLCVIFRMGRA